MIIDPYSWQELPIQHLALVASDTLSVRIAKPVGYDYRAGQYAIVRVRVEDAPLLRQYSFASCPDNDFLEFLIQREPHGIVSNWFHAQASVGMTVEVSQPFGSFVVDNEQHPVLLIAGRIGVVPFISIIRDELSRETKRDVSLLYSARGEDQFCYPELLQSVATRLIDTAAGTRIDATTLAEHLTAATRVYLCGSKQFVDSLTDQLRALDVAKEQLRRELFTLQ